MGVHSNGCFPSHLLSVAALEVILEDLLLFRRFVVDDEFCYKEAEERPTVCGVEI
jgi:hypothetical protein